MHARQWMCVLVAVGGINPCLVLAAELTSEVKDTYGRHFVFPVPACFLDPRPLLLVSSERGESRIELIISGLFRESIKTTITQFTKFSLPCRELKTSGTTTSGAISLLSSDDVMLHVTYLHENFMIYPVSSLGVNYTVFLDDTPVNQALSVVITSTSVNNTVFVQLHNSQHSTLTFDTKELHAGEVMQITLHHHDVACLQCTSPPCVIQIQGSESVFVLQWQRDDQSNKVVIEQIAPNDVWGTDYVLPLATWIDENLTLYFTTDPSNEIDVTIKTTENKTSSFRTPHYFGTLSLSANEYLHLSAKTPFQVYVLMRDASFINDTFMLMSGVAIEQYRPLTCKSLEGDNGRTVIAYEEYTELRLPDDTLYANSTDLQINFTTELNFIIMQHAAVEFWRTPVLHIPLLKQLLGAYSVYYLHNDETGHTQIISGGSNIKSLHSACVQRSEELYKNNTECDAEGEYTTIEKVETDVFSLLGCRAATRHTNWVRGRLKAQGITPSVIAVIISIIVAVIAVIVFIMGVVVIDLTGEKKPRNRRVLPIEDDLPTM